MQSIGGGECNNRCRPEMNRWSGHVQDAVPGEIFPRHNQIGAGGRVPRTTEGGYDSAGVRKQV